MLSSILDRISFWALFLSIVLLPIFFLPFTKIPVETSKSFLLVVGLSISVICWAVARLSDGKIVLPKSLILVSGIGVVFAFLVSALVNGTVEMSLFGIMFDLGTFWSVFLGYLMMLFSSFVFKNKENAKILLLGFIGSLTVAFVFQIFQLFISSALVFGAMDDKTTNLIGSWNSFGLIAVMGIIMTLFLMEFYSISKKIKISLGIFLLLSLVITMLVNFPLAWKLLGIFSIFIFVYKVSYYSSQKALENKNKEFPIFSFVTVLISLLFFISGQFIGNYIPSKLNIYNIEASPSFSSTIHVGNSVIKDSPIFGIGPNNFEQAWSKYKPALINSSQYWNTSFYTGSGLIPTFFVTTGLFGTLFLVLFFFLIVSYGAKRLFINMKSLENVEITVFFVSAVFLTLASLFYATGVVIFFLLFIFIGVFVGLYADTEERGSVTIFFLEDPRKSFFSIIILLLIITISAGLSFKYVQRFVSAHYFAKAVETLNPTQASQYISAAIKLYANDLYLRTYSQIGVSMVTETVQKVDLFNLSEEGKKLLQNNYDQSVQSALLATSYNPKNSLNWELLGYVYNSVSNLGLVDEYDKAIESYKIAATLNPLNPALKLSIAQVMVLKGMNNEAKEYVTEALILKPNYKEALIMMSQIEKLNLSNN